jgi:FlaA1/EpsC-like NDP-sugar epimerase
MQFLHNWLSTFTSREFDKWRRRLAIVHDVVMIAFSFAAASILAVGFSGGAALPGFIEKALLFTVISAVVCFLFELNSGSWRYASIPDLTAILKSATVSVLAFVLIMFVYSRGEGLSRLALFLVWFFMVTLLAGPRILYRMLREGGLREILIGVALPTKGEKSMLIYKINDISEAYIRAIRVREASNIFIVGVLDEIAQKGSRTIQGLKVLGTIDDLGKVVERIKHSKGLTVTELAIADQKIDAVNLGLIVEMAANAGLKVSLIPDIVSSAGLQGMADLSTKPLAIKDLIGRKEIVVDLIEITKLIEGKTILVTGAGGSIGSEIARQIVTHNPKRLVISDNSEHFLYTLDTALRDEVPSLDLISRIVDVRNLERVDAVFAKYKPDIVFHAAALKHVPLVEQNINEAIKTNVLGTRNCANVAVKHGVAVFVMISTDKAVNPTNVMGVTKRAAEAYCQALDLKSETTKFKTVRFGNVLDSNGSVVPRFAAQIAKGGPVTVTHPNIVRYFMTIPEAVALVLYTSAIGLKAPDERGKIVVLNMGEPVRIADLAERMIRLAGFKPNIDIKIDYIGLRKGEKLFEEMFAPEEEKSMVKRDAYIVASPQIKDLDIINRVFNSVEASIAKENANMAFAQLRELVPEYNAEAQIVEQDSAGAMHSASVLS